MSFDKKQLSTPRADNSLGFGRLRERMRAPGRERAGERTAGFQPDWSYIDVALRKKYS